MKKDLSNLLGHASPESIDLIEKMLEYNPQDRITCEEALKHPFFSSMDERRFVMRMHT